MFDMTTLKVRYFQLKLRNGLRLDIEPPQLKSIKKIMKLSKINTENISEEDFNGLAEGLSIALSKNKQKKKITVEFIEDNLNIEEVQELLTRYFEWVDAVKTEKNY